MYPGSTLSTTLMALPLFVLMHALRWHFESVEPFKRLDRAEASRARDTSPSAG
jgi:hypothetical protein